MPAALESLLPINPPKVMPKIVFQDPSGAPVTFANFKGKRVMAFFWSASCVPCLKTMTELNQMAEHYGGKAFEVVPISVDSTGSAGAKALLDRQKWPRLRAYADPSRQLATALGITQLPTTILVDTAGRASAVLLGPQPWDSPDFIGSISNLPTPKTN
ncbi:MAG: TlpA family protein disulfide reductase [Rhodospirillales bacterium]|nr:MAG: TlpA family protein disulfide reductase [Rhodospirillales bacterium]